MSGHLSIATRELPDRSRSPIRANPRGTVRRCCDGPGHCGAENLGQRRLLTFQDDLGDALSRQDHVLMRPESKDHPSSVSQERIRVAISGNIRHDLRAPPSRVCFRPGGVFRTRMPKATIHEYDDSQATKNNVGPPASLRQCAVNAIAKPERMQRRPQRQFAGGVPAACYLHSVTDFGRRSSRCLRLPRRVARRSRAALLRPRPT